MIFPRESPRLGRCRITSVLITSIPLTAAIQCSRFKSLALGGLLAVTFIIRRLWFSRPVYFRCTHSLRLTGASESPASEQARCASCHDDRDVLLMKSRSLLSNQIMELKLQHEQERTHLLQQHNTEKDSLVQDHQREIASLEKQARSAMAQHQAQTQEWRKRDGQTISELESQVHSLREELLEAHAQRKQQLSELGLLCEEERQRAAQEQEVTLGRVRADMERVRKDLERTHTAERELAQEKVEQPDFAGIPQVLTPATSYLQSS
ncbi:centrosomal protein of 112 kDa isoform X1 [Tachysurus ichikawai]